MVQRLGRAVPIHAALQLLPDTVCQTLQPLGHVGVGRFVVLQPGIQLLRRPGVDRQQQLGAADARHLLRRQQRQLLPGQALYGLRCLGQHLRRFVQLAQCGRTLGEGQLVQQ